MSAYETSTPIRPARHAALPAMPLSAERRDETDRGGGGLMRGLGLAVAPMLLFASIPVGLVGAFPIAGLFIALSLILLGLDAVLFGRERR